MDQVIKLSMTTGERHSKELRRRLYELFNLMNQVQVTNHFVLCPHTGKIEYRAAMLIVQNSLNRAQFYGFLHWFLKNGIRFYTLIHQNLTSNRKPFDLVTEFMEDNPDLSIET